MIDSDTGNARKENLMPTNAEMLKVAEGMQAALQEINEAVTELERGPAMLPRRGRLCVEVVAIADGRAVLRFGWVDDADGLMRDYVDSPPKEVGGRVVIGNVFSFPGGDDDATD